MMKRYIENLRASSDEANLRNEKSKAKSHQADPRVSENWKPLTEQIEALMRSLPPVQRNRPWSMEGLCLRLKGKYSEHPHPMHVGQALRGLGWTARRDWTRDGSGRRYWMTKA